MANKRRSHDEEAWTSAKKICRLTARQVEMARRLGMTPKTLPGLRPSPHQRWKLPVGEFIEECHRKRFGGNSRIDDAHGPEARSRTPSVRDLNAHLSEEAADPARLLSDLACYLVNLADDLQQWLAHRSIDPDVLPQVREELLEIVKALETGQSMSPIPAVPLPPRQTCRGLSRRGDRKGAFDDEEIPF